MDYKKIYDQLIESRRDNRPPGYTERHHIIPEALGGSNDKENKVRLTGREHWIAHLLLHRIHNCQATACACHRMTTKCKKRGIPKVKNSRMFQYVREEHAKYMSIVGKRRTGKKNGSYGTMWICNVDLQENKKIKKTDEIPDGWIKGRNSWNKKPIKPKKAKKRKNLTKAKLERERKRISSLRRKHLNKREKYLVSMNARFRSIEYTYTLWDKFVHQDGSLLDFSKLMNMTHQGLSFRFRNHIREYSEVSKQRTKLNKNQFRRETHSGE